MQQIIIEYMYIKRRKNNMEEIKANYIIYNDCLLEDCFILYHSSGIACECNADDKIIQFVEE